VLLDHRAHGAIENQDALIEERAQSGFGIGTHGGLDAAKAAGKVVRALMVSTTRLHAWPRSVIIGGLTAPGTSFWSLLMAFAFDPPPTVSIPIVGSADRFPARRVYCVGRNYVEHAKEMGFTGREPPFFFMKPADALLVVPAGSTGEMPYPSVTRDLHHELELVVAIGHGGRDIPAARAAEHVFGYAIGLDMTRRDLQGEAKKQGRPWEVGKAFEASGPIGPIHPSGGAALWSSGAIALEVNGGPRQSSDISKLIWNIGEIIEHLSALWTLAPGDLIFTGTPEGVAAVNRGDLMVGRIDRLGELRVKML
jgi:fumarylpyruvate hydrolase